MTTTFSGTFTGDTAFKNEIYQDFLQNELGGNAAAAFVLSTAYRPGVDGLKQSGWSFGPAQYDLGKGTGVQLLQSILSAYAASGITNDAGNPILTASQIPAIITAAQLPPSNSNSLNAPQIAQVDAALVSGAGIAAINADFNTYCDHLIGVASQIAALAQGADQSFLQTDLGKLFICDYANQFHVDLNSSTGQVLSSGYLATFVAGGAVDFKDGGQVQMDGPLGLGQLLRYMVCTKYGKSSPWDLFRRYAEVASAAGGYSPNSPQDALAVLQAYTTAYLPNKNAFEKNTNYQNDANLFIGNVVTPADQAVEQILQSSFGFTINIGGGIDGNIYAGKNNNSSTSIALDTRSEGQNDVLIAGAGNYQLIAGDGNDTLIAGVASDLSPSVNSGNDELYGDIGNDVLDGGNGNDTFLLALPAGGAAVEKISSLSGNGAIYIDGDTTALGGGGQPLKFVQGRNTQEWTADGAAGNSNELSYTFSASADPNIGVLTITGGELGSNQIQVQSFNLKQAVNGGYLGIQLQNSVTLSQGIAVPNTGTGSGIQAQALAENNSVTLASGGERTFKSSYQSEKLAA